jgi:6-phosphogluconolactonase (cycloisomerase 2 family)
MSLKTFLMAGLATSVSATKLLVSGYGAGAPVNGSVLTLELSTDKSSLKTVSDFTKMGPQPTWLDTDLYKSGMVLGLDEAWATEKTGGLYSLKKGTDGTFNVAGFATVLGGPVSTQFYNNNTAVAIAHYGAGAISTFKVSKDGALSKFHYLITCETTTNYLQPPFKTSPTPQQAMVPHRPRRSRAYTKL